MAIKIKALPEVDIMGKKYTVGFENSEKVIEDLEEIRVSMSELNDMPTIEKMAYVKKQSEVFTNTILYEGAFKEIFEPLGKKVGVCGYVNFLNDLVEEVKAKYKAEGQSMDKISKALKQAEERKLSK